MKARPTHNAPLSDEELSRLLSGQGEVLLNGSEKVWREVERQVERLGFGEAFLVSFRLAARGGVIRISPAPGRKSAD